MQKAGSEALAEAICLYDKKIDKKSAEYSKCLTGQVRWDLFYPVSHGSCVRGHAFKDCSRTIQQAAGCSTRNQQCD